MPEVPLVKLPVVFLSQPCTSCWPADAVTTARLAPLTEAKAWSQTRNYSARNPVRQCTLTSDRGVAPDLPPEHGQGRASGGRPNPHVERRSEYNESWDVGDTAGVAMASDRIGIKGISWRDRIGVR